MKRPLERLASYFRNDVLGQWACIALVFLLGVLAGALCVKVMVERSFPDEQTPERKESGVTQLHSDYI